MSPARTDVLIIGGGPAGLAAAIALRQKNIACTVVDALQPNIDKGCGEGLMPDALHALRQLGITLSENDGHPLHGIRFLNGTHSVQAAFPAGAGLGVRRTTLHRRLTERAAASGAHLSWKSHVTLLDHGKALINGQQLRFKWLIGADGQMSTVRRWSGLSASRRESARYAHRLHYRVAPWSNHVEVHWRPDAQAYVTPVAPDTVCLALVSRIPAVSRAAAFSAFPAIAARITGAEISSPPRGAVTTTRRLRRVTTGCTALIGDASGSADCITGEGLAISFRQALALAGAIEAGDLTSYERAHRHIGRVPHNMGRLMLAMDRWPSLQRTAIRALSARPEVFASLLSVHAGRHRLSGVHLTSAPQIAAALLR